jgi:hypothetical protein
LVIDDDVAFGGMGRAGHGEERGKEVFHLLMSGR